jgi:hypothetical protein
MEAILLEREGADAVPVHCIAYREAERLDTTPELAHQFERQHGIMIPQGRMPPLS